MQGATPIDPDHFADDTELWRRVPVRPGWVIVDRNDGRVRPSSGAFKDNRLGSISAYIAAELAGVEEILQGHEGFAVVGFSVGFIRRCGLRIERDPSGGAGHVLLHGDKEQRITVDGEQLRVREALALYCHWVGDPPESPGQ